MEMHGRKNQMYNIIDSLLDTDFYKFTMMQAIYHKYTGTYVEYAFKWRNWNKIFLGDSIDEFINEINFQIDNFCELRFKESELEYLQTISFLTQDFIDFLRLFKLNRDHICVYKKDGEIKISIKGPWLNTILFETPVLAIVSELHSRFRKESYITKNTFQFSNRFEYNENKGINIHRLKLNQLDKDTKKLNFKYGDFGTRRRFSKNLQDIIIDMNLNRSGKKYLVGTSNVYFAKKYGIKPLGTQAHEWFQVHQQMNSRLIDSQKDALQSWADEYRGDLGIALSDCMGMDAFLVDFDKYFAKLFDGCRHDSGNPYIWCNKLINHYKKLGIDPKTKTALFSDGLTFPAALSLYNTFKDRINTSFGIGTYITNDTGIVAPQIVLKVVRCNGLPVAKISDSDGKGMCEDKNFETYLKQIIDQKII